MSGFTLPLTCPRCGADVEHVTSGRVIAGRETSAIVRCTECVAQFAEYQVHVRLLPLVDHAPPPVKAQPVEHATCGTDSGYFAHIRQHREQPCQACRDAHSAAERERTAKRRRERVGVLA